VTKDRYSTQDPDAQADTGNDAGDGAELQEEIAAAEPKQRRRAPPRLMCAHAIEIAAGGQETVRTVENEDLNVQRAERDRDDQSEQAQE